MAQDIFALWFTHTGEGPYPMGAGALQLRVHGSIDTKEKNSEHSLSKVGIENEHLGGLYLRPEDALVLARRLTLAAEKVLAGDATPSDEMTMREF